MSNCLTFHLQVKGQVFKVIFVLDTDGVETHLLQSDPDQSQCADKPAADPEHTSDILWKGLMLFNRAHVLRGSLPGLVFLSGVVSSNSSAVFSPVDGGFGIRLDLHRQLHVFSKLRRDVPVQMRRKSHESFLYRQTDENIMLTNSHGELH